jgi:hypothetical protein
MEVVLRSASRLVGNRLLDMLRKPVSPSMVVPRPPFPSMAMPHPGAIFHQLCLLFLKRLLSSTGHFARLKKVTRLGVGSFFLVMGYPAFCQTPFAETIL